MREVLLILLLFALALGGCAVTVTVLQPTINGAAHAWVQAETATDPIDDLVRFRRAERDGRAASLLLPVFVVLSAVLLLLALAAPLPRNLKELRLLRKAAKPHRQPLGRGQPWLEQPPPALPGLRPTDSHAPDPPAYPLLPPPQPASWLEDE